MRATQNTEVRHQAKNSAVFLCPPRVKANRSSGMMIPTSGGREGQGETNPSPLFAYVNRDQRLSLSRSPDTQPAKHLPMERMPGLVCFKVKFSSGKENKFFFLNNERE